MTWAARMKLQPREDDEQATVVRWAGTMTDRHPELSLLYAIPNGSYKGPAAANRFKTTGLRAGVPDLHLPVARGGYHGLWLELKRQHGGIVSDVQTWWHDRLRDEGHRVAVCRGAEPAIRLLMDYLKL